MSVFPAPMTAKDSFSHYIPGLAGPYTHAAAVTPHDVNELGYTTRALYVGTAGALKVVTGEGDTVTFGNVGVGELHIRVKQVFSTGTAAANIVALW